MAALKVKFFSTFICPECGSIMLKMPNKDNNTYIECVHIGCRHRHKKYALPEIEVIEYENRDGEK